MYLTFCSPYVKKRCITNIIGREMKNALGLDSFDWLIVLSHITVLNHRAHPRVREGKWKIKGRGEWRVYIFLWCSSLHISHPALWINKGWMKWRRRSSSCNPSTRWTCFVSFITSACGFFSCWGITMNHLSQFGNKENTFKILPFFR